MAQAGRESTADEPWRRYSCGRVRPVSSMLPSWKFRPGLFIIVA